MEKELWLWGPLFKDSIEIAKNQRAQLEIEPQHIAVDGGILAKTEYNPLIEEDWLAIGDGDSSQQHQMDILYPADKSKSDLTLALDYIQDNISNRKIRAFGFSGGRDDHQLIALGCFQRFATASRSCQLNIDGNWLVLSPGHWTGHLAASTVSLITLDKQIVSLTGAWKWGIVNKDVHVLDDLLLSNQVDGGQLTIKCTKSLVIWSQASITSWWQAHG